MQVRKRNGSLESVNIEKIINSISKVTSDLDGVDHYRIATRTVGGLFDGVSTRELDELSIQTAVGLITEDPIYSKVAARLLDNTISKEVDGQEIHSFTQSIQIGFDNGLIGDETYAFVMENKRKLNAAIKPINTYLFDYYGLKVVYDRYLLKHPTKRTVIETPQYFMLRVACGLSSDAKEAIEFYNLISSLEYMSSTPTLFNSGTRHAQMSSCYLLDSPLDDLVDIEKRHADIAKLSKWAGGIGLSYSRVRGNGALIKGTNGRSNGIVPFLHSLSANVAAVNQGGKRKGAAAAYLDTHHPDIMEFLELRDQTGEKEKRAYNLNLANWIPDLFMNRVAADAQWSLIDSTVAPDLVDLFGAEFEARYLELEAEGKFHKQVSARSIWTRMMKTLAETGNGWMCWKDTCNVRGNTAVNGSVIHSSNLCTEILEPTHSGTKASVNPSDFASTAEFKEYIANNNINITGYNRDTNSFDALKGGETAVCNLGSLALGNYEKDGKLDKAKLRRNAALAVKFLDKVIDRNFYPTHEAYASNMRWRPIGLGIMGLQDLLFKLRIPFESPEAVKLSAEIQEEIYYTALKTSVELAKANGPHQDFEHTHAAKGLLQFDLAGQSGAVADKARWDALREEIRTHGLRNSLMIAIAPTVTIAAITGSYECSEPQVSNLFKTETLSGEFIRINKYLVDDLKKLGLWNVEMKNAIISGEGSIQHIANLPEEIRALYKTVWEVKQKWLIDHAAARGLFIDQSQSLNLFMETPSVEKLSSMYMYAWKSGIKTTYYLRSRGATKIAKTTVSAEPTKSLENPDVCESCT
jgi:ribonucleoside-diphosphate reductase alpha chain